MRLFVRHRTAFCYAAESDHLAQVVRMAPRDAAAQQVIRWSVHDDRGRGLPGFVDGFGNLTHLHTLLETHREAAVVVEGVVETRDTAGVLGAAYEPLPPAFFTRATPLTAPHPEIAALAAEADRAPGALVRLHRLLGRVRERVAYRPGVTHVGTTAAEALLGGAGVCQDHAHVFVAAARALGIPARYVGGYLLAGGDPDTAFASHAWAEAWVADLGWVGFDPSHGACPTERYVRASVGRDYTDAAPIRGIRRGEAGQTARVSVQVEEVAPQ
jgi:transglutaminase-like putative cysteine protease